MREGRKKMKVRSREEDIGERVANNIGTVLSDLSWSWAQVELGPR